MLSLEFVEAEMLDSLKRQISLGKLASTYIFSGSDAEKSKALATAFAQALQCEMKDFKLGCTCSSCRRIASGVHPDVSWLGLDEEVNSIKIAEVREFQSALALKPYEGKYKVFIFNRAERLSTEAQNALLKSLEEPPPSSIMILLVRENKLLFNTIESRAMKIRVPPFRTRELEKLLIEEGAEGDEARFLARVSSGSLGRARSLWEESWFQKKNEWLMHLKQNPDVFFEDFHGASKDEVLNLFSFLLSWLRDLIVIKIDGTSDSLIHKDSLIISQGIAEACELDALTELFESMESIRRSLLDHANQKLALTRTQMIWTRVFHS